MTVSQTLEQAYKKDGIFQESDTLFNSSAYAYDFYSLNTVDIFNVSVKILQHCILLQLENKTDSDIAILWNDSYFMDCFENKHTIAHGDVPFLQMNNSQEPTILKKDSNTNIVAVLTENPVNLQLILSPVQQ